MLLTVMELWVVLDEYTVQILPMMKDYLHGWPEDILHVLHVLRRCDMIRIAALEKYLQSRRDASTVGLPSIFSDPTARCFAEQYFDSSEEMQQLHSRILRNTENGRGAKKLEWESRTKQYESLTREMSDLSCPPGEHDRGPCRRCYKYRVRKRLCIDIHEDPLPSNPTDAKCMVFEICCPAAFSSWRDTTWKLMNELGMPKLSKYSCAQTTLHNSPSLKTYKQSSPKHVTLGSTTKTFKESHYAKVRFPVALEDVCLPSGFKPKLCGKADLRLLAAHSSVPSFAPICSYEPSKVSALAKWLGPPKRWSDVAGPTPNEIVGNQKLCPSNMSLTEFGSLQELLSGEKIRWICLLRELASANISLSKDITSITISHLALRAGASSDGQQIRDVHWVLENAMFCQSLIYEVDQRVNDIATNWRESTYMDTLITLLLRVVSLMRVHSIAERALESLRKIRQITVNWFRQLLPEIHRAKEAEVARKRSEDILWATLLCRRTFDVEHYDFNQAAGEDLSKFLESSIIMHNHCPTDLTTLSPHTYAAKIRDMKLVCRIREELYESLLSSYNPLARAIERIWPAPDGRSPIQLSECRYESAPNDHWIVCSTLCQDDMCSQRVHYNILEGALLFDGSPVGKLPDNYESHPLFKQIFGDQAFLTVKSWMEGMSHRIAADVEGHEIHLGFRYSELIIRACYRSTIMELIPREKFQSKFPNSADLPLHLINGCVHWLDLRNRQLFIRPQETMWRSKFSDWTLNLQNLKITRRRSELVDPTSTVFNQVTALIVPFESRSQMIVYQPHLPSGDPCALTVQLMRLDLKFEITSHGLLRSRELQAVIDLDQDIGTFYGLESKLALRDIRNRARRSVIVPMGTTKVTSNVSHVRASVTPNGMYCRFEVNELLQRLDCPPEPRFIYLKALYHASTSSFLPDPLTGRTGIEEALRILKSGLAQPWMPLDAKTSEILHAIAKFTPSREYYPKEAKNMQRVAWSRDLPMCIQNDSLSEVVTTIIEKSNTLQKFFPGSSKLELPHSQSNEYLRQRSVERRRLYAPNSYNMQSSISSSDSYYSRKMKVHIRASRKAVYETVSAVNSQSSSVETPTNLAQILSCSALISGFGQNFEFLLSNMLRLDLSSAWGPLFSFFRETNCPDDKYRLVFYLAAIAFAENVDIDMVRTLVAVALNREFRDLDLPPWPAYTNFQPNESPTLETLVRLIDPSRKKYPSEMHHKAFSISKTDRKRLESEERLYNEKSEQDCYRFAKHLLQQWPCPVESLNKLSKDCLLDVNKAMISVRPEWERLFANLQFSEHITQVQKILDTFTSESSYEPSPLERLETEPSSTQHPVHRNMTCREFILQKSNLSTLSTSKLSHKPMSLGSLVFDTGTGTNVVPANRENECVASSTNDPSKQTPQVEDAELQHLIVPLKNSSNRVRRLYGQDLQLSLEAGRPNTSATRLYQTISREKMTIAISKAKDMIERTSARFGEAVSTDRGQKWREAGDLVPKTCSYDILCLLADSTVDREAKRVLIDYAQQVAWLQRLLRLEHARQKNDVVRIEDELGNPGHEYWNPTEYPEWLLLEIESNITIRPDQVDVALATMHPKSKSNSLLQMNMGLGKSSCIIPMAACRLADSQNLLRVIVPKSLLTQMASTLQKTLGNLLDRQIMHVPFSRRTSTRIGDIEVYGKLHEDCAATRGIVLCLPEHLLSFKLSGQQRLLDQAASEAERMLRIQKWLDITSRDILDESDHTLDVRTQLIYPSGTQTMVDGHPNRWKTSQALLNVAKGVLPMLQKQHPKELVLSYRSSNGFPSVFFLDEDMENEVCRHVAEIVCEGGGALLPVEQWSTEDLKLLREFLCDKTCSPEALVKLLKALKESSAIKQTILLLRGLLAHGLLAQALGKRHNVQYGVHPQRHPIAVPFRAKGVPSEHAEWGHPDVAILLTCLSFYNTGLSFEQVKMVLEHLFRTDDPSSEYDRWAQGAEDFPPSLKAWTSINLDDETQLKELSTYFRSNMTVIDYFLNTSVFPRHAKQFEKKLQASGWDLPHFSGTELVSNISAAGTHGNQPGEFTNPNSVDVLKGLTTGFSGTNDNRSLLPLTVRQKDLPRLQHTNAEVLKYLLQPRNRQYTLMMTPSGARISELQLLEFLETQSIRVLIDAGAQILEMDNLALARAWLAVDNEAKAALYFNKDDEPIIWHRNGMQQSYYASTFADNLRECLVYLDEAHTRGTDLKLPADAVGALTLSPGQTKDHTVQAAMRLRQLGSSQSVVFFAPPEVDRSIRVLRRKNGFDNKLDSSDVVSWLLEQSCKRIEQMQPLYISQGYDFLHRSQASTDIPSHGTTKKHLDRYLQPLIRREKSTLADLYAPKSVTDSEVPVFNHSPEIRALCKELEATRKEFEDRVAVVDSSTIQEVEQEREIEIEVENVREIQRPPKASPLRHKALHPDVLDFATNGVLNNKSNGYKIVSVSFGQTSLGKKFKIGPESLSPNILATSDFTSTVELPDDQANDNYIRPLNWLLWSPKTQIALIVSPVEAEALLPTMTSLTPPKTYLVTYAAPITRKMMHFDNLTFFSLPSLPPDWKAPTWLSRDLGIFAGRLFFRKEDYAALGERMGLQHTAKLANGGEQRVVSAQRIAKKPLAFMQEWLSLRRKGQDFSQTTMGYICEGKKVPDDHPFFNEDVPEAANGVHRATPLSRPSAHAELTSGPLDEDEFSGEEEYFDAGDGEHNAYAQEDWEYPADEFVWLEPAFGGDAGENAEDDENGGEKDNDESEEEE